MKPYAYAVVQGEDGKENVSLQFDHPEMCGQKYKQAIPLFTTPQTKQNRPVAWMSPDGKVSQTEGKLFYIPLYTTPQTKPLSDEEIWNWFKENTALTKESALRIARAIEERHGIK